MFVVAVGVAVATISGAGAAVPAKTVPPKQYVKQLCRELRDVQSALNTLPSAEDLAGYQAQALENDAAILTTAETARTQLSELSPTKGKRKVTTYWDGYFEYVISAVSDARDVFAAAGVPQTDGPSSEHFQALLDVSAALTDIIAASYSSSKEVFAAFGRNATCEEVDRIAQEREGPLS